MRPPPPAGTLAAMNTGHSASREEARDERRRGQRLGLAGRQYVGAAWVHAGGPGRTRGRAGRAVWLVRRRAAWCIPPCDRRGSPGVQPPAVL